MLASEVQPFRCLCSKALGMPPSTRSPADRPLALLCRIMILGAGPIIIGEFGALVPRPGSSSFGQPLLLVSRRLCGGIVAVASRVPSHPLAHVCTCRPGMRV